MLIKIKGITIIDYCKIITENILGGEFSEEIYRTDFAKLPVLIHMQNHQKKKITSHTRNSVFLHHKGENPEIDVGSTNLCHLDPSKALP